MVERPSLTKPAPGVSASPVIAAPADIVSTSEDLVLIPSGATLLDLGLGGGWACGRVANIVGDTSTGKTLLAIEVCANFAARYGTRDIRYNETENAFSRVYGESVGLPPGIAFVGDDASREVDRRGSHTVEEFEADFDRWLKPRISRGRPCLYILDSFDALEAESELNRKFGDRQPGAKAALSSEFYRTHIGDIYSAGCLLLIVYQLRDAIGVMFGETKVRSGGKSHDFYASQIVWLATGKIIKEKRAGVEREIGIRTRFRVKKNKTGKPHHHAPLSIYYNYGIDDEMSCLEWLQENHLGAVGRLTIPIKEYAGAIQDVRASRDLDTLATMREELREAVRLRWAEIESAFAPVQRKYPAL
jgi:recombination protein RecA